MPIVAMPDGTQVNFPDEMPPEQIKGLIASKFPDVVPQEKTMPGIGRTALDQGLQGATFNFGKDITARLGALGAYGVQAATDLPTESQDPNIAGYNLGAVGRGVNSLQALTNEATQGTGIKGLEGNQERLDNELRQRPVLSIGSNIAGALLTGGASATTKIGSEVAGGLRTGEILGQDLGLTGRIAKGAAAGATAGGVSGFGAGSGIEDRLQSGVDSAETGAALGAAAPAIGAVVNDVAGTAANIGRGIVSRGESKLDEAYQAIRSRSSAAYDKMRSAGAVFTPQSAQDITNNIEASFYKDGAVNSRLHGKVIGLLDDMKDDAAKPGFSLENLDHWRQLFGEVANDYGDKLNARKASIVINKLDDMVENIGAKDLQAGSRDAVDALNTGRAEYARARKFEKITDLVKKSDNDPNALKRGLKSISDSKSKSSGFSNEEKNVLKEASRMNGSEAILKVLGKFGFSSARLGNGVGAAVGSGVGYSLAGGPAALAVPVAGTIARKAQQLAAKGKVDKLLKTIENDTGAAKKRAVRQFQQQYGQSQLGQSLAQLANMPITKYQKPTPSNPRSLLSAIIGGNLASQGNR